MNVSDENLAYAICEACGENPNHQGDSKGNEFRWQDYMEIIPKFRQSLQTLQDKAEGN